MAAALAVITPLLLIIMLGFAVGGVRRIAAAEPGLNTFVLYFALPAFLFDAVAGSSLTGVPAWFFPVTVALPIAVFTGVWIVGRAVRARHGPRALALTAAYGNVGYLGLPVVMSVLGPEAGLAAGLSQLGHNMLFMAGYPVLASLRPHHQRASGGDPGSDHRQTTGPQAVTGHWLRHLRRGLVNPVLSAVVAGLIVAAVDVALPQPILGVIDLLAAAAVPAALFSIGLALRKAVPGWAHIKPLIAPVAASSAVKMLLLPAVTVAVLSAVGESLSTPWAATAVLMAVMPTSATAYLYTAEHDDAGGLGAATVFVSTVLSLAVLPGALLVVL